MPMFRRTTRYLAPLTLLLALSVPVLTPVHTLGQAARPQIPRMPDGKPNLQGIWQVRSRAAYDLQDHAAKYGMPAGKGVVEGGEIPYQPWALAKKAENFANRAKADPLG